MEILFTTAWEIWNAWNRFCWDHKASTVDEIWQQASGLATNFIDVGLHVHDPGGIATIADSSRWRPPDFGTYKVNIGIRMGSNSMKVGVGILIRDSCGLMAAAM